MYNLAAFLTQHILLNKFTVQFLYLKYLPKTPACRLSKIALLESCGLTEQA